MSPKQLTSIVDEVATTGVGSNTSISENTSESCEYHSGTINYGLEIYICCGQKITGPPKPCRKSYHVMCRDDMRFYLEAKKKYRKEILQKNINDDEENDEDSDDYEE